MRRPALAKPTRSLRCSIEVDPNWVLTTSSAAGEQHLEVVADVGVDLLGAPSAADILAVFRPCLLRAVHDDFDLGLGDPRALHAHGLAGTHRQEQPVTLADELLRTRLVEDDARVGRAVANASRDGTLALMRPVTTSTDGRWVASTRWIPDARASWVMRTIESSTSRGATIIRSASSSTITSRYGYGRSTRSLPTGQLDLPQRRPPG